MPKIIEFPLEYREFDSEEQCMNACAPTGKPYMWFKNGRGKYQVKEIKGGVEIKEDPISGNPTITISDPEVGQMIAESIGYDPEDTDDAS